jgi:hypothetical protein
MRGLGLSYRSRVPINKELEPGIVRFVKRMSLMEWQLTAMGIIH